MYYFLCFMCYIINYVRPMEEAFCVINNRNNNNCKSIIRQQNKKAIKFPLIRLASGESTHTL